MQSDPIATSGMLHLGEHAIRLVFDSEALTQRAFDRLYLSADANADVIGEIYFRRDDGVSVLVDRHCPPNAVVVDRVVQDAERFVLNLKVFGEFTVSLTRERNRVFVRYPSHAPITYLLDDVLQAAAQPFLDMLGGFILHGACMVKNGSAFALMGNSGSGKSTTAFNLVRAGYHCYADDAILVTTRGSGLYAWPFSREMSIRPLSFQLLESQGMSFSGYRHEGKKYYFRQPDLPENKGVPLRHACLIEVRGERDTQIERLTPEVFLDRLLGEQRYFSFVNREHHEHYAGIVTERVPERLAIYLGQDLEAQSQAFDSLLDPAVRPSIRSAAPLPGGRAAKLDLIRDAWRAPGKEPLRELIPMLTDSDLKIFKNALSFFQNYPLARIEPRTVKHNGDGLNILPGTCDWLRVPEWADGCRHLIQASCREAYDQYATGWFRSAPILYAFLNAFTEPGSAEHQAINAAWSRCLRDTSASEWADAPVVTVSIHSAGRPVEQWDATFGEIASAKPASRVVVLPVFESATRDVAVAIECMRAAHACGLRPGLAQSLPLCWLDAPQAAFLLEHNALLTPRDTPVLADGYRWTPVACDGRAACHLSALGLCSAGYVRVTRQ